MRTSANKLAFMSILAAIALIVFIIEAQIPLPIPIPGTKLGLANTVTLFALFFGKKKPPFLTAADAFLILVCRILLGAAFTGRGIAFLYSLSGGFLGFAAQVMIKRILSDKQVWVCGAAGGMFHNIGQILAAMLITGTPLVAAYLPVLIVIGIVTGVLTGLVAQLALARI